MKAPIRLCLLLIMLGICEDAGAAAYPDHAILIVVPFPPGGPLDVVARIVGPKLGERLGALGLGDVRVITGAWDDHDLDDLRVVPLINYGVCGLNRFEHFDAGLARASTRQHQQRPGERRDRFALGRVEGHPCGE